jgi:hypothetical protein
MAVKCYKCQTDTKLELNQSISRNEECPQCAADLRCCKMCNFYDPKAYNECKEPTADRILEKEKANFCDFFKLGSPGSNNNMKADIMAQADALFKK